MGVKQKCIVDGSNMLCISVFYVFLYLLSRVVEFGWSVLGDSFVM